MDAMTRVMRKREKHELWESPLLWSTVALYSVAALLFFWTDFGKIFAWVGA